MGQSTGSAVGFRLCYAVTMIMCCFAHLRALCCTIPDTADEAGELITITAAEAKGRHMVRPYKYLVKLLKEGSY